MFYDATTKDIKFSFSVSNYRLWVYRNMIAFVAFDLVSCDPDKVSPFSLKLFLVALVFFCLENYVIFEKK